MARIARTWTFIVLLTLFVGCQDSNRGNSQIIPISPGQTVTTASIVDISNTSEADLVEQIVVNRQAYRQSLETLEAYYARVGNNLKLNWVRRELQSFDAMTKYFYITGPERMPSSGQPIASIPEADRLYQEAERYERRAGLLPVLNLPILKDENSLRMALARYNQLIKNHPSSDKIDDAAYKAGVIYEYFKDYSIALLYYQSAYEWDPEGLYPARFRGARILDRHLYRKDEALQLYQQAVKTEGRYARYREWREFAEKRIRALQKLDEGQSQ
ncbi:tol-pal system YbgF family protein [Planctomycetota bacterium]